jgi:arylsulfatase A-like enzyme
MPSRTCGNACADEAMAEHSGFRSTLVSLWFRLVSLGIVGLVFAEALFLGKSSIQGWTFYLTTSEVAFEVVVRLIFTALIGILLSTLCTAIALPFVRLSPARVVEWIVKAATVFVLFIDSRYALTLLIQGHGRGPRFIFAAMAVHVLAFVVALAVPHLRKELLGGVDIFLGEKAARSIAIGTVAAAFVLAITEFAFARATNTVRAADVAQRPKSNVVLVTFDAFTAEEMSLYGYRLPTTPNLDAFAKQGTVFTNFYAASTFTTPCIGVMLTGAYPSESHIYGHLGGRVQEDYAEKNLPTAMRDAGYASGAFVTNPWAYYFAKSLKNGFDVLSEPVFHPGFQRLWQITRPLHQDSRIGSRIIEYFDLEIAWNKFEGVQESPSFRFRPNTSFDNATKVLDQLPDGFFLWVHVLAPHHPYLPDPPEQNRYIPETELQQWIEEPWTHWKPHYEPEVQAEVDRHRLAYDEYIQSTDRAFGNFMAELEKSGDLRNTTVIVSADHGESFEGGVYRHQTADLTRPVIHIPLIIRMPGQQTGHTVSYTADQTALAPTILDIAGQPKPPWMHGESLAKWLKGDSSGVGQGLAFTQHLERNSVFKPLYRGTVGVLDSEYEYVFYLEKHKGELRPLNQAHNWNLDVSTSNPSRAESLRATLHSKFPEVVPAE